MLRKSILTSIVGFVCSLHAASLASAQQLAIPIPQQVDPLLQNLTIPADAPTKGMWSAKYDWPLIAMHSAMMPDGRLATFGSPVGVDSTMGHVFDIWNPKRGFIGLSHRQLANSPEVDSFCAAANLLKTGELLTSGGNRNPIPNDGLWNRGTSLLNAARSSVSTGSRMASPRYYSTQTVLADGRVLITGGGTPGGGTVAYRDPPSYVGVLSGSPELYTPGSGWISLTGATSKSASGPDAFGPAENRWWYPRQWVAPDGKVFGLSARQMWYLDPNENNGSGSIALFPILFTTEPFGQSTTKPNIGATSTAVMFDVGKILQVGGNGRVNSDPTDDPFPTSDDYRASSLRATIIDINTPGQPLLMQVAPMHFGRQWANATVLPNGHVLVTGGTELGNSEMAQDVTRNAEIWNPATNTWMLGPAAAETRVYHSTAILLPNGTALTAGGGGLPEWNTPHPGRFNAEVYYPPYLFQASGGGAVLAARPRIVSMNARKFSHGAQIQAEVPTGQTITKAVLIGLGSTTHSFDMGQRLIPRQPTQNGTIVSLAAPNANLTPPGYYFLFLSNQNGVPSEGIILAIGSGVTPPPKPRPVLDFDGDRRHDMAIYRPGDGGLHVLTSSAGFPTGRNLHINTGAFSTDVPVPGDYDGDGITDMAVYRPSDGGWHVMTASAGFPFGGNIHINTGAFPTDVPMPGDYDGDGITDMAVYRPSDGGWHVMTSSAGFPSGGNMHINTGAFSTDIPMPGDYDGDGITDMAVYRPGDGGWHVLTSSAGFPTGGNMHIHTGAFPTDIALRALY